MGGNAMNKDLCYAVIGAGNGGLAMAGYLAIIGYKVNLYNRTLENILPLVKMPKIKLSGETEGEGKLNIVTNNIEKAINGADIIMVTVPAIGHSYIGKQMAPFFRKWTDNYFKSR